MAMLCGYKRRQGIPQGKPLRIRRLCRFEYDCRFYTAVCGIHVGFRHNKAVGDCVRVFVIQPIVGSDFSPYNAPYRGGIARVYETGEKER